MLRSLLPRFGCAERTVTLGFKRLSEILAGGDRAAAPQGMYRDVASVACHKYAKWDVSRSVSAHYLSEKLHELELNPGQYRTCLREAAKLTLDRRTELLTAVADLESARTKMDESTAAALTVARRILAAPVGTLASAVQSSDSRVG